MALGNLLSLAQVTGYLITFIFSFLIFIPVSVTVSQFRGHCLLYSTAQNVSALIVNWGADGYCNFPIAIAVILMLVSLFYLTCGSVYLFKNVESSWLDSFLGVLVAIWLAVMLLISGCILQTGFDSWCELIRDKAHIQSCEDTEAEIPFLRDKSIYTGGFYMLIGMSLVCTWLCFICWILQTVFISVKLWNLNRIEPFMTSMNRERQRLIQRVDNYTRI